MKRTKNVKIRLNEYYKLEEARLFLNRKNPEKRNISKVDLLSHIVKKLYDDIFKNNS